MPVEDYGVWKGLPVHYEVEHALEDPKSPHLSLYYHDNKEREPQFDHQYRHKHKHNPLNKSRPREIPGLFRAAINIKSIDRDSRLAYWVNYKTIEHPIVQKLANLNFGFHPLEELDGQGLDYIRSGLFDTKSGRVLPHDIPGPNNDVIDVLVPEVQQSIEKEAEVYIFGSCFNTRNGMHNVHMNQGNIGKFRRDDGAFQDGGLLIHYKDTGQWTGVFLAFASQAVHTDNKTGHAIPPLTWGEFLPKELTENSVVIKEASVKKHKSVTLANLTSHKVSLASWKLCNSAGQVHELPGDAALNSMATRSFEVPNLHLSSDGDTITLLDEYGLKVDGVSYRSQHGKMEGRPIEFRQLMERRGDDFQISEELVKAAAGNKWKGKEVMSLLLERSRGEIPITEEIIRAAAGNKQSGQEVMTLLILIQGLEDDVKTGKYNDYDYNWIRQLRAIGYSPWDIAELLLEKTRDSPWIYFDRRSIPSYTMESNRHIPGCFHLYGSSRQLESAHNLKSTPRSAQEYSTSLDEDTVSTIEELCGIAGICPTTRIMTDWIGSAEFSDEKQVVSVSYSLSTDNSQVDYARSLRSRMCQALEGLRSAAGLMQKHELCCDSFTVLKLGSYDYELPPIIVAVVKFQLVNNLIEALGSSQQPDYEVSTSNELLIASKAVLDLISPGITESQQGSDIQHCLDLCALAVQLLCVGFLSYTQAHIGPIQPFFLDTPLRRLILLGLKREQKFPFLVAEPVNLSCFGNMTHAPVLTFSASDHSGKEHMPDVHEQQMIKKHDVQGHFSSILDTWGPGSLIFPMDAPSRPVAIKIGNGFIFASNDGKCHWAKSIEYITKLSTIDIEEPLLVGALVTVNTLCSLVEADCRSLSANTFEYLGTSTSSWEVTGQQIGVSAGKFVTGSWGVAVNKRRGTTLKDIVLDSPEECLIEYLDEYMGVQVSYCTGVARRVPLRILVADVIPAFCGGSDFDENIDSYLRERSFENFQNWFKTLKDGTKKRILTLIRTIVKTLRPTGLNVAEKYFYVAWPFQTDATRCFKIPLEGHSSWTRILADSHDCATFAYITMKCLETDNVKCSSRTQEAAFRGDLYLLETAVTSTARFTPTVSWTLENGKVYFFSKLDSVLWVKVRKECTDRQARLVQLNAGESIPREILQRLYLKERRKQRSRLRECRMVLSQGEIGEIVSVS